MQSPPLLSPYAFDKKEGKSEIVENDILITLNVSERLVNTAFKFRTKKKLQDVT